MNSNAPSIKEFECGGTPRAWQCLRKKVLRLASALLCSNGIRSEFRSRPTPNKQTVCVWCDKNLSMLPLIFLLHIPGESRCCEQQCDREGSERCHCTRFARGLTVTVPCGSLLVQGLQFTQFIAFRAFRIRIRVESMPRATRLPFWQCARPMTKRSHADSFPRR